MSREAMQKAHDELAALIPAPLKPQVDDWPCSNPADRDCLQRAYTALRAALEPVRILPGGGLVGPAAPPASEPVQPVAWMWEHIKQGCAVNKGLSFTKVEPTDDTFWMGDDPRRVSTKVTPLYAAPPGYVLVPSTVKRFTAYRRNISQRDTHNELQKNADSEPQFEGVIWTDGTVTLRWLTACRSHSVWASIEDCLNIHGHPEYGTEIVWHDGEEPAIWQQQCEAAKKGGE